MKAEMSCDFLLITRNTLDDEEMVIRKLIDVFPPLFIISGIRPKKRSVDKNVSQSRPQKTYLLEKCVKQNIISKGKKSVDSLRLS